MRAPSCTYVLAMLFFGGLDQPLRAGECPPPGSDRSALEALKSPKFELADDARRQKFALG
jgi:hypothetical protein